MGDKSASPKKNAGLFQQVPIQSLQETENTSHPDNSWFIVSFLWVLMSLSLFESNKPPHYDVRINQLPVALRTVNNGPDTWMFEYTLIKIRFSACDGY